MTEMQQVVRLMLDRLEVDLATDEVAVSMCAFQVLPWLDRSKENMLRKHVAVLAKVFKMTRDVSKDFAHAAKTLANLVQTCKMQQINVTHKVAWSWVLVPQWRSKFLSKFVELPKDLEMLIVFFLSIKMNTTTLERNLGELCRQLAAHGGHGAEDGSLAASLLEVALDGPQREEDLFERIETDGESRLSPTEFGRSCARLWVLHFGRRFRYKYVGTSSRKKQAVRPGSFKAVLLQRDAAADRAEAICAHGSKSWWLSGAQGCTSLAFIQAAQADVVVVEKLSDMDFVKSSDHMAPCRKTGWNVFR
eukprot:s3667_g8.t1